MYLPFFKFKEYPFSLTPDTQFFLNQKSHSDALNTLLLALDQGEGFIKIVGEVGTGKTLLCRILLSRLVQSEFVTAYIPNPWLNPDELKLFLASEIGADLNGSTAAHEVTAAIYRRLMQWARQGKKVVLVVDEAQAMPRETLEALRLLTNLETEKSKLLQVVLLGQPELDVVLNRKDLRQFKQRIVFSEYLKPLSAKEVNEYLSHRLGASGAPNVHLFSEGAAYLIYQASGGVPRMINILAHKALMCAYGRGDHRIVRRHIARAIVDTPESRAEGRFASWLYRLLPQPAKALAEEVK